MGPVRFTFLADEVLGWYDALHDLERKVVEVVAKVEFFGLVIVILVIVNIDALQIGPCDLVQAGDRLCGNHIDFLEGLKGPTERWDKIPLQVVVVAPCLMILHRRSHVTAFVPSVDPGRHLHLPQMLQQLIIAVSHWHKLNVRAGFDDWWVRAEQHDLEALTLRYAQLVAENDDLRIDALTQLAHSLIRPEHDRAIHARLYNGLFHPIVHVYLALDAL